MNKDTIKNIALIFAIAMLVMGIAGGVPYGFYTFLRIVICATSAGIAFSYKETISGKLFWVLIASAILFNPVLPFHLGREIWIIVDLAIVCIYGYSFTLKYHLKQTQ